MQVPQQQSRSPSSSSRSSSSSRRSTAGSSRCFSTILPLPIVLVFCMQRLPASYAQNNRPIDCIECSTYTDGHYCADPFNFTHPEIRTIRCTGACAKWVLKPQPDELHFVRTCSSNLNMQMNINLVCMSESRPGDGHLCFCKKKKCNDSPSMRSNNVLTGVMAAILVTWFLSGPALENWLAKQWTSGVKARRQIDVTPLLDYENTGGSLSSHMQLCPNMVSGKVSRDI